MPKLFFCICILSQDSWLTDINKKRKNKNKNSGLVKKKYCVWEQDQETKVSTDKQFLEGSDPVPADDWEKHHLPILPKYKQ